MRRHRERASGTLSPFAVMQRKLNPDGQMHEWAQPARAKNVRPLYAENRRA
jgi:hypothetical protein